MQGLLLLLHRPHQQPRPYPVINPQRGKAFFDTPAAPPGAVFDSVPCKCRPTAFGGGAAGIGGLHGRLIAAPTGALAAVSRRRGGYQPPGPHHWNQQAPGHRGPAMAACGHAALRRSAEVRRESRACSGGHKGRPYDTISTWSVGRGAHTPPMQAAGITMACGFRNPVMAACGHAALSYEAKSLAECSCQIVRCCLRYFSCPWR